MGGDEPPQTRWWWNCTYSCGAGGGEGSPSDRDQAKAAHEMVCPKNPVQPDYPRRK